MEGRSPGEGGVPYTLLPHTGDLAVWVRGRDLPELFVNAALALFDIMTTPPVEATRERQVTLDAVDTEALLVDWLNALLLLHESEGETYTRFVLDAFTPTHLSARVCGGPTAEKTLVVKAATYHELHITPVDGGVEVTVVFDI